MSTLISLWFFCLNLHQVVELLLDAKAAAPGGEDLAEMLEGFLPKIWCFPFGWKHVKYPKGHVNKYYELAKICHGTCRSSIIRNQKSNIFPIISLNDLTIWAFLKHLAATVSRRRWLPKI